jgi:hypothetical protein
MWLDYLQPYYLVFLVPAGFGLFLLALLMTGVRGHHGAPEVHGVHGAHGAPAHGAHGGPVHGGPGVHQPAHAGPGGHQPHVQHAPGHSGSAQQATSHGHARAEGEHGAGGFRRALDALGLGETPLLLVAITFSLLWGFSGWLSNQVIAGTGRLLADYWLLSVLVAGLATVVGGRLCAALFARALPQDETSGITKEDLLRQRGRVRYTITATSGSVMVEDRSGYLHEVRCRVLPNEQPIPKGTTVYLTGYDPDRGTFSAVTENQVNDRLAQLT